MVMDRVTGPVILARQEGVRGGGGVLSSSIFEARIKRGGRHGPMRETARERKGREI